MCIGGSLHVSHEFGLFSSNGRTKKFKDLEIRSRGHIISSFLSSRTSRQSAWAPHVSNMSCEQIQCLSSRHKSFSFRAFAASGHTSGITLLRIAGSNLSRSYTALNEIPLTVQLVKAIGIIAFALCGLEPLMRHSRNLLLHQSDNSWKNSRGYGFFTSYLQPVLIWTGVTLICRALEPVPLLSETSQAVKQRVLNFIRSLSTVLAFAYCLSRLIQQVQKFFLESKDTPDTRNMGFQFAGKAVYSAVWVAALSLFMELLGFSTKKMDHCWWSWNSAVDFGWSGGTAG